MKAKINYLKKLVRILTGPVDLAYNLEGKKNFRDVGIPAMKELARILRLREVDINFNPGGSAVPGDLRLIGTWGPDKGIYISMTKSCPGLEVLYRTARNLKDFTGGSNQWTEYSNLAVPEFWEKIGLKLAGDLWPVDVDGLAGKVLRAGLVEPDFQGRDFQVTKRVDYGEILEKLFGGVVPDYVLGAGKTWIRLRTESITNKSKVQKITIEDVAKYYAFQAPNFTSGCRTLAGIVGDWRCIDEMAHTCLEYFKLANVEGMRKAGRALGIEPKF